MSLCALRFATCKSNVVGFPSGHKCAQITSDYCFIGTVRQLKQQVIERFRSVDEARTD